ncbi:MAG TPA: helix-turn-helix domain-containing protein [Trebonia sp.]
MESAPSFDALAPRGRPGRRHEPTSRDLGKERTRQALIEAALRMFAEDGYDGTTAEAIAARAGVTSRTLFRHFPTKESILFSGEDRFYRSFIDAYGGQARADGDLPAILRAFVSVAPVLEGLRDWHRLYRQATASSSTLRGQEQRHLDGHVASLAEAIAGRRGAGRADTSCRVLATVSVATVEMAITDWATGRWPGRLPRVIEDRFALLAGISDAGRATGSTESRFVSP